MNTLDLNTLTILHGKHSAREQGVCAMEAVAWLANEPHSDHPLCACPVIGAYVINLNDNLPAEQRQRLKDYLPRIVGTKGSRELETKRAFKATDLAVRVFAVSALKSAGLNEQAGILAALAPIVDESSAAARAAYADAARADAAYAYAYADAARAATYAARAATYAAYADAARAATYAARAATYAAYAEGGNMVDPYALAFAGLDALLACVE